MPKDIVIIGPPGTGKTEAAITVTRGWFRRGASPEQVAYLAFTKDAAREAATRIFDEGLGWDLNFKLPYFRTIHSLAYFGLHRQLPDVRLMLPADMRLFAKWSGLEGAYSVPEWEDLSEIYATLENHGKTDWDKCLGAYTLSRIASRTVEELQAARTRISDLACRTFGFLEEDVYRAFVGQYELYKKSNGLVDFTDMLEFALTEMLPLDNVKYVVIDEFQDVAPLLDLICQRLFRAAKEIWYAGDEDQCQPTGTSVLMEGGLIKPIEEVKQSDHVVSFDRRAHSLVGLRASGKCVRKVSSRKYSGLMYTVEADQKKTVATAEHKFIARWTFDIRNSKDCVTYLMERDGKFRVGWCQLFNSLGLLHLVRRARIEKAGRAWILSVHTDRTDASIHESVVAARYGIPTATFEPVSGANHLTSESIKRIFDEIGDVREKANACLMDHDRLMARPFYDREKHFYRKKSTIMEIEACNMIDGLMMVPVHRKGTKVHWEVASIKREVVCDVDVYSLDVDGLHTYVADGIITHNCIFSFAAADPQIFIDKANGADCKVFLTQTHRFGSEIVDFSRQVIQRVRNRIPKDVIGFEGRSHTIRHTGEFRPVVEDMFILHRHVMGCQAVGQSYFEAGLPYRNERGKDPLGPKCRYRVEAFQALHDLANSKEVSMDSVARLVDDLMPSTFISETGEKTRLVVHGAKKKLDDFGKGLVNLHDLVRMKLLTTEGYEAIALKRFRIFKNPGDLEYYDKVLQNGHKLDGEKVPVITTQHASKGRQAKKVIVFSERGRKCAEEEDAEHRLAYVAATRTKGDLEICGERMVDWAEMPYEYPAPQEEAKTF